MDPVQVLFTHHYYLGRPLYYTTMVESYEALLKKAYSHMPEVSESHERFTVPETKSLY